MPPLAVIPLAATPRGSLGASTCSPQQPTTTAAKNTLPAAGQPRAREAVGGGGEACGAILRGLRDYSWPVNIDSASSGATAQPGSTVFRARWEARRVAESGALSEGGRGQGEDVSSVIFSERLPAAARERGTPRACRRLRGGRPEPLGCTERLPGDGGMGPEHVRQLLARVGGVWGTGGRGQPWLLQSLSCWVTGCCMHRHRGLQVAKQVSGSSLVPCLS